MDANTIRNDFIKNFWSYYEILESDCANLRQYMAFREENMSTCSDEIIKQLISVSAEFDNLSRSFLISDSQEQHTSIADYANYFLDADNLLGIDIRNVRISVRGTGLVLEPFSNWSTSRPSELTWWRAYNKVKHDRSAHYLDGTLGNLLNALAALFFLESFSFRKIALPEVNNDQNPVMDVPPSRSNLFDLLNFSTSFYITGHELYVQF